MAKSFRQEAKPVAIASIRGEYESGVVVGDDMIIHWKDRSPVVESVFS